MNTITTTVTSAAASGVTTTVTTTEATSTVVVAAPAAPAAAAVVAAPAAVVAAPAAPAAAAVGAAITSETVINSTEGANVECDITSLIAGKRVILIGVPGAFTPTCSNTHVPGYIKDIERYKAKGIDSIICMSVNDGYVMNAWSESLNKDGKLIFIADPNGKLTTQLGFGYACSLGGTRCRRFAAVINDCKIEKLNLEPKGVPAECSLSPSFINEL